MAKSLVNKTNSALLTGNENPDEGLSRLMSLAILAAELFGSGKRDTRGDTTQSTFVARREGVTIDYAEESRVCYISGHLKVSDKSGFVLEAERSTEDNGIQAGINVQLGYRINNVNISGLNAALESFYEGLKLIGHQGMQLPLNS